MKSSGATSQGLVDPARIVCLCLVAVRSLI